LFETDFPHPTSQHPGPQIPATTPEEYVNTSMGQLPEDVRRKLLFENAAKLYNVAA
jgi:uncharacterized protein